MRVREDETLKAACHGILLGCVFLPLAYNLSIRKWANVFIYSSLVGFELYNIADHLRSR